LIINIISFQVRKSYSYGEGDTDFRPLAGALDVSGHEMTHGVVGNSARLEYLGQSGAINESMVDVFGCAMDPADWLIGEDVVLTSAFPTGALRSISDPHNGGLNAPGYQPRTMAEYVAGSADSYGVHANSGIPNWAYYKFATAISRAHGEQIWYRALTTYLSKNSQWQWSKEGCSVNLSKFCLAINACWSISCKLKCII